MKSTLFLALALAIPSTGAMASSASQKLGSGLAEPSSRKAGCTGCACCDFIVIGGLKIPIGFPVAGATSRRD